jgi:hypothetical protein
MRGSHCYGDFVITGNVMKIITTMAVPLDSSSTRQVNAWAAILLVLSTAASLQVVHWLQKIGQLAYCSILII